MKSSKNFEIYSLEISRDVLVIVYGSQYLKFMTSSQFGFKAIFSPNSTVGHLFIL